MTNAPSIPADAARAAAAIDAAFDILIAAGGDPVALGAAAIQRGAQAVEAASGPATAAQALRAFADELDPPGERRSHDAEDVSDRLREFSILHGGRPNVAFLQLVAERGGTTTYELPFAALDKLVIAAREFLLERCKSFLSPGPDAQQEVDTATAAARRLIADWRAIDAPIASLWLIFASEIAREAQSQFGRARATELSDYVGACMRRTLAPQAPSRH